MWDWFDHEDEKEEATCVVDFTPITKTMDPTATKPQDVDGETGTDLYADENRLFEKNKKRYQPDKETELGFPDERKEFVAKRCLKDVQEEFEAYSKERELKPIKNGMGLMLHGDEDFKAIKII